MSRLRFYWDRIDWVNSLFLVLTPLIACSGVYYLHKYSVIPGATIALAVFMAIAAGLGITAGYHRLFSHKTYECSAIVKIILLALGASAFQNSARKWSSDHRNHHKFVDTEKDPYNIQKGFWWAHIGWVMFFYSPDHKYDNVADLSMDKWVLWQEKHCLALGIGTSFLLPMLIASLWGDPLGGLLIAGFLRVVLNHHFTFSINSFCHMIGNRPYSDRDSSRDNWFLALVTYGEGYHNFHHKFPSDYRNGIKAYHWDPTKWLIKGLSFIGHTSDLRKIDDERILQARLRMDEKRVLVRLEGEPKLSGHFPRELIVSSRLKFEEAHARFNVLKAEYQKLKTERMAAFHQQVSHLNERLEKMKLELLHARESLAQAIAAWVQLCKNFDVKATRLNVGAAFD